MHTFGAVIVLLADLGQVGGHEGYVAVVETVIAIHFRISLPKLVAHFGGGKQGIGRRVVTVKIAQVISKNILTRHVIGHIDNVGIIFIGLVHSFEPTLQSIIIIHTLNTVFAQLYPGQGAMQVIGIGRFLVPDKAIGRGVYFGQPVIRVVFIAMDKTESSSPYWYNTLFTFPLIRSYM